MSITQLAPTQRLDETKPFQPVRIAVLTVSDTRSAADDKSGDTLVGRLTEAGHLLAARAIVRDDAELIVAKLQSWISDPLVDAVITTGGTGLTGRDVTVEAAKAVFEKEIDGFAAIFHLVSYMTIGTSTLQSRACAGLANGTFIFCLPGSTGAVKDGWDHILRYQFDSRHRPCNFVDIMPRLMER
jgi:molybdenum cofactor biosynthesis protein B